MLVFDLNLVRAVGTLSTEFLCCLVSGCKTGLVIEQSSCKWTRTSSGTSVICSWGRTIPNQELCMPALDCYSHFISLKLSHSCAYRSTV